MESLHVDMMAEARNAQWSSDAFLGSGAIKILSPAKVNLFLGIGQRMASGYHQATTVLHSLALHDTLFFNCKPIEQPSRDPKQLPPHVALGGPVGNLLVSIDVADKTTGKTVRAFDIPARENLVFQAIDALASEIGYVQPQEIAVRIEKNIPSQAGLGGGSSNAAAALLGCAHFWGLPEDGPSIHHAAQKVGADVPFFLYGGCARFTGIGDELESTLVPAKFPVVLVKPNAGISTAEAYAVFDDRPEEIPAALAAEADNATSALQVPLFNNMTRAAESLSPELREIREWLLGRLDDCRSAETADAPLIKASSADVASADVADATLEQQGEQAFLAATRRVLLCGSGACTFAIAPSFSAASSMAAAAQAHGWWSRATTLSRLKASVMERR